MKKNNTFNAIAFLIKPYFKETKLFVFITFLVYGIVKPVYSVAGVLFTQDVIDAVSEGKSYSDVLKIIGMFLSVLLITLICENCYTVLYAEKKHAQIQKNIGERIYKKVKITDYRYFDNPKFYDDYAWALNEYSPKSREAYELMCNFLCSISTIVSMFSLILIVGPMILVLSFVEVILSALFSTLHNKIEMKKRERMVPQDRRVSYVQRVFYERHYAEDVKTTNVYSSLIQMHVDASNQRINIIKYFAWLGLGTLVTQNMVAILYNAGILAYISYGLLVSHSIIGVGKFMSLLTANSQMMSSLVSIVQFFTQANIIGLCGQKVISFFKLHSCIENSKYDKHLDQNKPVSIKMNNVSFSYENTKFALQNINLSIKPGEKIAIVGDNGAGKSTLLKLLLRLYDPVQGNIQINGEPLNEYDLQSLRENIGVEFQHTNIYAFSVLNNLKLYRNCDEQQAEKTVDKLGLNEIFTKFSADMHTDMTREFNENGVVLSVGEEQKLGVARLMLGRFSLLILDEPTAALDPVAEYKLSDILFDEANKTTTIIVAHRLSMVRRADRIIVMSNGEICEVGTHEQLIDIKGKYYEMFTKQAEYYS